MRLEQVAGALLWAILVLYAGYCWLHTREPRPKNCRLRPSPQLPSAFRFGYDPYNTVHAHLIAIRNNPERHLHNLIRDAVSQPISPELEAKLAKNIWSNTSRYDKT